MPGTSCSAASKNSCGNSGSIPANTRNRSTDASPLPASPLGGDLFLRFGEKLRALALEEERILRKRAEYCRCRLSARFSKKHFRQLAGFHLALFSAEGFPE